MTKQNNLNETNEEVKSSVGINRNVLYGVIAIVVIALALIGVKYFYLNPKVEAANTQLTIGLQYMDEGQNFKMQSISLLNTPDALLTDSVKKQSEDFKNKANDSYNKALNGDGVYPGFLKLADDLNIASAQAGICYYQLGKYKEAIQIFEAYSAVPGDVLSAQYLKALADCYTFENQTEKAIETLIQAAAIADNFVVSPNYLLEAGQLYESLKKNEEALKIYQQIKKDYPQSNLTMPLNGSQIDKYIERVSK